MKLTIILIFGAILSVWSLKLTGQGNPFIQNYSNDDYHTPENQTWAIAQDTLGVMYFGNNKGLLQFNGSEWQLMELPNKSTVRSLALNDENARLYVGGVAEMGFIRTTEGAEREFVSLVPKIPLQFRSFENVWHIEIVNDKVFFRTNSAVYVLDNDTIQVFLPENRFHTSFKVGNKYYIREWDVGLFEFENEGFHFIESSQIFSSQRIYAMLPVGDGKILMATRESGIWIFDPFKQGKERFVQKKKFNEASRFVVDGRIYGGLIDHNGNIILSTLDNGFVIMNQNGEIMHHFNKKTGLRNSSVLSIYLDNQHNIWAGLNDGISYVITNSKYTRYTETNGINGTVMKSVFYNDKLYILTSNGLYLCYDNQMFDLVKNSDGQCWCLENIDGDLYLGHTDGLFLIKNKKAIRIIPDIGTLFGIYQIDNSDYYLLATVNGLYVTELTEAGLVYRHKVEGVTESCRYLEKDSNGVFWMSHPYRGAYKIRLSEDYRFVYSKEVYSVVQGFPSKTHNYVNCLRENKTCREIVFGTENGIYKYDSVKNRFLPDERFACEYENKGYIDLIVKDKNGNVFFQQANTVGCFVLKENGTYVLDKSPYYKLNGLYIEDINLDDSSRILFSSKKGLIEYSLGDEIAKRKVFKTIITEVSVQDSVIYSGFSKQLETVLPYSKNDLHFSFSALFYEDHNKTRYSYRLKGFRSKDDKWSEWTLNTQKEYTNLRKGEYTFMVKAKNIYQKESKIAEFTFEILPPWYATIYAYVIYAILIFLTLRFIVRVNVKRLKKDKEILEVLVQERTAEITKQKEAIETKNKELKKLSIVASETSNAISIYDTNGNIEWFNDAYRLLYGYNIDDYIKHVGSNIIDVNQNENIEMYVYRCRNEKVSIHFESQVRKFNGEEIWIHTTLTPILNDQGGIERLVAIDTDIDSLKQAETEILQKSEEILAQNEEILVQNEELERHRNNLESIVKERTAELVKAKEKAEESDRLKTAFLANMSHEIRTPMNAIVGFTELINDPDTTDNEKEDLKIRISESSASLVSLIDDIIDSAKIETDQIEITYIEFDLNRAIQEVVDNFSTRRKIDEIDLNLVVKEEDKDVRIVSDKYRIQQIIRKLLDNALKFTENGFIEVGYRLTHEDNNDVVLFYVKDSGIGMSVEKQTRIFERFNKITDNKDKLFRGAGLGLFICNGILSKMNGRIWVDSKLGRGSTFYFSIPIENH